MAQTLTLELPDAIYERVVRTAVAMKQPVEKALVHLIKSGLPPLEAPAEFEADLSALEALDDDALWEVLLREMPAASQRRLHRLLDKNSEGTLTIRERRELEALRKEGDCLMLRKAHAAVILKWRGHRIPTVAEIKETAMRKAYISPRVQRQVEEAAHYRCGYCLTSQDIIGQQMHLEHLIPRAAGGLSVEENLWLACPACNEFKGVQIHAIDPVTGRRVRLFRRVELVETNPRKQKWKRHFQWSADGTEIIGKTPIGRATVVALQMNHSISLRARQK